MQDNFEFDKLPDEIKTEIARYLRSLDLINFAGTSTKNRRFFKSMLHVPKLLYYVVRSRHDSVQSILKDDVSLMLKRGRVTDCSGREFESISAFEYALWALDKHMWAAMIACIPQNKEDKKVFEKLIAQYNKVKKDGVAYRLRGKIITEPQYDFAIIKELHTQINVVHTATMAITNVYDLDSLNKQWKEGVGGAQILLPMHVVDEYCSNEPFSPMPDFLLQPPSSRQFNNLITGRKENWFNCDSRLGIDFAIYKGPGSSKSVLGYEDFIDWYKVCDDLTAMVKLHNVRTKDVANLKLQLEKQLVIDNEPQVFQI
ncbi:SidC homolog [Legionella busanensis]|uniref:SidC homolog n=1 Tax=Legionella busanensis TaxID=190655 RepID=A0A378K9L5_9GAMM|nr:F-box protein [Legionella busanensis]STX81209.1 SidC homolog [Legionella busanensis]